jgi:hypothetical protein
VAVVRTDVLEEHTASIIKVSRIGEVFLLSVLQLLVTANVVPSSPSETSVLTGATRRIISEDAILRIKLLFWVGQALFPGHIWVGAGVGLNTAKQRQILHCR